MNSISVCPICQHKLIEIVDRGSYVSKCENCGWQVVTSLIAFMHADKTIYSINVDNFSHLDTNKKIFVAHAIQKNTLQLLKMIDIDGNLIIKRNARDAKMLAENFLRNGISITISPNFRWLDKRYSQKN